MRTAETGRTRTHLRSRESPHAGKQADRQMPFVQLYNLQLTARDQNIANILPMSISHLDISPRTASHRIRSLFSSHPL